MGETASGYEQRNQEWSQPRVRYSVGYLAKDLADRNSLIGLIRLAEGRANTFGFKDQADWYFGGTLNSAGEFVHSSPGIQIGTGNGTRTVFQLVKPHFYGAGSSDRRILLPNSIRVYVAGSLQTVGTHYTLSNPGGVITFTSAPANGAAIQASGSFWVPVRFDSDEVDFNLSSPTTGSISVSLIEVLEVT